jgi:hypothetical protein
LIQWRCKSRSYSIPSPPVTGRPCPLSSKTNDGQECYDDQVIYIIPDFKRSMRDELYQACYPRGEVRKVSNIKVLTWRLSEGSRSNLMKWESNFSSDPRDPLFTMSASASLAAPLSPFKARNSNSTIAPGLTNQVYRDWIRIN